MVAASERVLALGVGGVACHEIGHALLFARPEEARQSEFVRLFGDVSVKYRVGQPCLEVERRIAQAPAADRATL